MYAVVLIGGYYRGQYNRQQDIHFTDKILEGRIIFTVNKLLLLILHFKVTKASYTVVTIFVQLEFFPIFNLIVLYDIK
jgi:hypothetical protein